jgi:hypothetical protein
MHPGKRQPRSRWSRRRFSRGEENLALRALPTGVPGGVVERDDLLVAPQAAGGLGRKHRPAGEPAGGPRNIGDKRLEVDVDHNLEAIRGRRRVAVSRAARQLGEGIGEQGSGRPPVRGPRFRGTAAGALGGPMRRGRARVAVATQPVGSRLERFEYERAVVGREASLDHEAAVVLAPPHEPAAVIRVARLVAQRAGLQVSAHELLELCRGRMSRERQ